MNIDDALIDHLSHLARLEFKGKEREKIREDLEKILKFMGKLSEVDTEEVEPLIHLNSEKNVLREDVSEKSITHEEAMLNAPKKDSDYFRIPKVLEK